MQISWSPCPVAVGASPSDLLWGPCLCLAYICPQPPPMPLPGSSRGFHRVVCGMERMPGQTETQREERTFLGHMGGVCGREGQKQGWPDSGGMGWEA